MLLLILFGIITIITASPVLDNLIHELKTGVGKDIGNNALDSVKCIKCVNGIRKVIDNIGYVLDNEKCEMNITKFNDDVHDRYGTSPTLYNFIDIFGMTLDYITIECVYDLVKFSRVLAKMDECEVCGIDNVENYANYRYDL